MFIVNTTATNEILKLSNEYCKTKQVNVVMLLGTKTLILRGKIYKYKRKTLSNVKYELEMSLEFIILKIYFLALYTIRT